LEQPDGKGILIVDDEPLMRRSVRRVLRSLDPQLREAPDGPTALKLIEEAQPAVLLTDYKMPGMNGRELAEAVHARFPQVRIVIHSGNAESVLASSWWPDFDVTLLPKPTHPDLMIAVVAAALADHAARS